MGQLTIPMSAASSVDSGLFPIYPDGAAAEMCLLDSVLNDIREVRGGLDLLVAEASAALTTSTENRGWSRFHADLAAAQRRTERALLAAACRDDVGLSSIEPRSRPRLSAGTDAERVARCRRLARELEHHASSTVPLCAELGLAHLSHALGRCRCELIGLEQPLIALQAAIHRHADVR